MCSFGDPDNDRDRLARRRFLSKVGSRLIAILLLPISKNRVQAARRLLTQAKCLSSVSHSRSLVKGCFLIAGESVMSDYGLV